MKPSFLITSAIFSITLIFSGCTGRPGAAEPVVIDQSLPQVEINGHLSDIGAIAFEWKPFTDPRVKGVRIYRDNPGSRDDGLYRIASVEGTLKTHYVDNGLQPATAYRYRFTTFDAKGRESQPQQTVAAATLKRPEPVSFFTATHTLARSAKLLWRPHPDLRVTGYVIERLDPGDETFHQVDSVIGRLNAEYIDQNLADNATYRYRVIAVTFDNRRTAPSETATVSTKPLPLPPADLKVSQGQIRTIDLAWSPSTTKDIRYYKVYRARSVDSAYSYHAKVTATRFTDRLEENGASYFYKVAAVDRDELESAAIGPAEGTTLAAPTAPLLTGVFAKENAVVIRWKQTDPRTVSYTLVKTTRTGWLDSKQAQFTELKTTQFTDVNVVPGREYSYEVIAVDKDGLPSEPSEAHSIVLEAL